ncbi:potassium channel family protein [Caulobacter sp. ErkDOM-YI]|uniref:potassium channel family protein n=1 Tax=unclassified Caulobacter TaxID=2648921 RepID=UPI003AF6050C
MRRSAGGIESLVSRPFRNLALSIAFVLFVAACAIVAYGAAGWPFGDALYMVTLTIFTVGYGEVRAIDTDYLRLVTMATMVFGCTGVIIVTGSLVQALTQTQLEQFFGKRVEKTIERLEGHTIICGFGRIGMMLAGELAAAGAPLVIIERDEARAQHALELGHLCRQGDATDEAMLKTVHIERAKVLATVLADDADNVFITLSARSLNSKLQIIARGERPSTEGKLLQAGADRVVLPTHIGAERIAELILFPEMAQIFRGGQASGSLDRALDRLGLDIEILVVPQDVAHGALTVGEIERRARSAFLLQINRPDGTAVTRPRADHPVEPGDGLVLLSKLGRGALDCLFEDAPSATA